VISLQSILKKKCICFGNASSTCQEQCPPEIEAAWLHHRFTQIHPFQDGN